MNINFLAVFLSSLVSLILGFFWYSVLFAKLWQRLSNVTDAQIKEGFLVRMVGTYVLSFLMALNLAAFIGPQETAIFGLFAGFAAGFGWISMALGTNYLFEKKPFKLFLINAGYNTILLSSMGLIIGLF